VLCQLSYWVILRFLIIYALNGFVKTKPGN